jgi:co-chaperonin GroES (HSP10)|tara:strand:+ start:342 stop:812 length:471 start_codon:yes stop_codon:yes gene_type:complete
MAKTLYVPEHIAKKGKIKPKMNVEPLYVEQEVKVLDPTLIEMTLKERLPQPMGWRILVMPYMGKATTDGGVFIPDAVRDREALATVVAYVLKIGPLAYQDSSKFGEACEPWCKEGQWICIGRYSGSRFKIEGGEVRVINDDEVLSTILEPDDIKHV